VTTKAELKKRLVSEKVKTWRSVLLLSRILYYLLEARLTKYKCSLPRLQVLLILFMEGPTPPVRLAKRSLVTRGNMSTLLKRMADEGLIEEVYEKARVRPNFKLSSKGQTFILDILPQHLDNIDDIIPELPDDFSATVVDLYKQIQDRFDVGVNIFPT
jgi:DNA-binding MarR family transcriptional regulator